jgi:SAM-dependent methyltransferase
VSEFTGERVIPGAVEPDLWAEHIARYAFAARFAAGKRVLDLGCGTGYGTAELAKYATESVGVDIAPEAIDYATENYRNARFVLGSAADAHVDEGSFDLVTSFELIEHLADPRSLIEQAKRALQPNGLFIVSTPNKLYYAEARGDSGPNPFHEHEFEYLEFAYALREVFPYVKVLLQDRLESLAFYEPGAEANGGSQVLRATNDATAANFFVAICSREPVPYIPPFVYVPSAANLLRERETHIHKLEAELEQVRAWFAETTTARDELLSRQLMLEADLQDKTRWAGELQSSLSAAQSRIVEVQDEFTAHQREATRVTGELNAVLDALNIELRRNAEWAIETDRKLKQHLKEHAETVKLLDKAEETVVERTKWAQRMSAEADELRAQLEQARQSRWVKLGRSVGLGPDLKS